MTSPSLALLVPVLAVVACTSADTDTSGTETASEGVTGYQVAWSSDPAPMQAGAESQFTLQVQDQQGRAIDDLQQNHERMVHSIFVSADLGSLTHTHQEDYTPVTADNLRSSTFSFPLTLPVSGKYFVMFDYAHENSWLQSTDDIVVEGAPAQAATPDVTATTEAIDAGVHASLIWTSAPVASFEADWTIRLTDADGSDVDDIVPFLGADAHCILVNAETTWGSHTHAWFPDMSRMTPSMAMPHLYSGPEVPFAYTFPAGGTYKIWVQFQRESNPGYVYTMPFVFVVAG
jgi:hypothetical protein